MQKNYLRGFPTINCNGVRTKKAKLAIFWKNRGSLERRINFCKAFRRLIVIILRQKNCLFLVQYMKV